LETMESATATMRAASLLHGLGFTHEMQNKKTKDFSGGWRMRIALARALLVRPALLLLDEPTNHLDLEACVWLEMELSKYNQILVLISHSQDFLNGVCTNIIHLKDKKVGRVSCCSLLLLFSVHILHKKTHKFHNFLTYFSPSFWPFFSHTAEILRW
jgi:ATPase subunit of ABC transporter with duplicated ATPase domains